MLGSVSEVIGEEVTLDRPDLAELADRLGVSVDPAWGSGKLVLELFEKLVEPTLFEPTFVCDFPREVSPLARPHRDDPALTEHFDVVIGGVELGTAFSELTDPIEQRAKFELQQAQRVAGDEEAHPLDEDFLRRSSMACPHRRHRHRHRPPAHAAHRRCIPSRSDPVPAPTTRRLIALPSPYPHEGGATYTWPRPHGGPRRVKRRGTR